MPSVRFLLASRVLCILALMSTATAHARPTPEQKCQAGKNIAAGRLAACLQNAEAKLVTTGDATKYAHARLDCSYRFVSGWLKLEAAAARVGATCLDTPLAAGDFQAIVDAHTDNIAKALGGGGLLSGGGLPKTGQTASYGPGSDGDLQKGVARSYTDNGDGTITDNVTGLMWEKKNDDGGIHDKDNTYTWGMNTAPYTMNGTTVTTFLATLNSAGGFAGFTDWRIPNRFELASLVNLETYSPAVSPAFNTACAPGCTVLTCSCTAVADGYWSATTAAFSLGEAWRVSFNDALVFEFPKDHVSYVRAVRTVP